MFSQKFAFHFRLLHLVPKVNCGAFSTPLRRLSHMTVSISTTLSSHRLMTNPPTDILTKIEYHKEQIAIHRRGMKLGIKYSSRRVGGHTTQYRRLCALAGIKIDIPKAQDKPQITVGKPCRYKACKGRNHKAHGEKCPVASSRGKTGGKSGTGESKQRLGSTNGNFRTVRQCGCPVRQHHEDCPHARLSVDQRLRKYGSVRKVRQVLNINPISWRMDAISVAPVRNFLTGVQGVCSGCKESMPASQAKLVHKSDVYSNPARVVCDACDA